MMDKTIDHRLAWLAGIIDGEGTVSIGLSELNPSAVRMWASRGRRGPSRMSHFMVVVSNTDERMIAEIRSIADVIGIKQVVGQYFKQRQPHHKPIWRITFKTRAAVEAILIAVLPYLITKRAQAELALRAIIHRRSLGQPRRGDNGYIKLQDDPTFAEMIVESHRLNRRGVAPEGG